MYILVPVELLREVAYAAHTSGRLAFGGLHQSTRLEDCDAMLCVDVCKYLSRGRED